MECQSILTHKAHLSVRQFTAYGAFEATATACLFVLFTCAGARAEQRSVGFTSFLREGPGLRYRVVDEVATNELVDVAQCVDGWCRLMLDRATGFVSEAALVVPHPLRVPGFETCFLNRGNGERGGVPERFCYQAPSTR